MLHNMVHSQEQQLSIVEEITSPIGAQIFEFCESEIFPETLQNSEVASSSNCCYEEHSSYQTNLSTAADHMNKYNSIIDNEMKPVNAMPTLPSTPTTTNTRNNQISLIFDPTEDNDISASIDFTLSPSFSIPHQQHINTNQEPFSISSINNQFSLDVVDGSMHAAANQPVVPILGPPLPSAYEEECGLSSIPSYLRLRSCLPGCGLIDPMIGQYLASGNTNAPFSAENSGIFTGNGLIMGTDLSHQELDFQGENSVLFMPDSMPRVFNCSSEIQGENQHLVHGGASTNPLASEISSLEDPNFKVGKLSVEERKRKIHRYMKKRNERNFSKKIKYACRKTLADSRPRVRGRFAKNDELGDIGRSNGISGNHEDDTDEDVSLFSHQIPDHQPKVVKEEDDMESSDIFAHISGVNSFKCNYPIQSWI